MNARTNVQFTAYQNVASIPGECVPQHCHRDVFKEYKHSGILQWLIGLIKYRVILCVLVVFAIIAVAQTVQLNQLLTSAKAHSAELAEIRMERSAIIAEYSGLVKHDTVL